jgi:hypothetical protein
MTKGIIKSRNRGSEINLFIVRKSTRARVSSRSVLSLAKRYPNLCMEAWDNIIRKIKTKGLKEAERYLREDIEPGPNPVEIDKKYIGKMAEGCRWISGIGHFKNNGG